MMMLFYYIYFLLSLLTYDYFLFVFLMSFILFFFLLGGPTLISFISMIDFLSWLLIMLLFFLFMVMIVGSFDLLGGGEGARFFYFMMGTLILFVFICFIVTNYFFFYLTFEVSVIPIFMIILGWGFSHERLQAGMYLFIYTLSLSLPFLLFLVSLSNEDGMGDYMNSTFYYNFKCGFVWIIMSVLVFLVKFPFYWLHLWLPKAHVEAPLSGSMVLAGILLKLGGYGFLRFYCFFVDYFFMTCFLYWGGLLGGVIAMLICFRQVDMKCMVAYMSVSHMSFLVSAFVTLKIYSLIGFLMMMISHGFSSSGMFALLGVCYSRLHSRSMMVMKSNLYCVGLLAFWGFMICMSSMSCPPTLNFFSEVFLVWGMASIGGWFFILLFCLYFISGSLSVIHFFVLLFHGKYGHFFLLSSLNMSDSFLLFAHIVPLMVGFFFM